jgi:hypothetical protein
MKLQKFRNPRERLRSVRRGCPRGAALAGAGLAAMAVVAGPGPVTAQQAATLSGPPVQVRPYVSEPGVPQITINPGTPSPFPSDIGGAGTGGGGTGGGGNVGSSDALNTMMGTTWGNTAVANAESLGVNPSALAATCVLESGCQNVGGSGTVAGAFQMTASTYTAMINQAVAQNPSLAGQIVPASLAKWTQQQKASLRRSIFCKARSPWKTTEFRALQCSMFAATTTLGPKVVSNSRRPLTQSQSPMSSICIRRANWQQTGSRQAKR